MFLLDKNSNEICTIKFASEVDFKIEDYYYSKLTEGVDFRAKNLESFDSLEKTSVDFYATVRSLYLQDRNRKILNSKETTETMNDDDWEEIDVQ